MRKAFWIISILLLLPASSLAQGEKKGDKKTAGGTDQVLMDIERKWAAAQLKSDAATLAEILEESWTNVNQEGKIETRAQVFEDTKKSKLTRAEVSEMKVHLISPGAAVVTGVWSGAGTDGKGQKFDTSTSWTDVYTNQGGKWKCVASQNTTIQK
jgi:ketosteroid isomerase-like protein